MKISFEYKLVLLVLVNNEEQVITLIDTFEKNIKLNEFDPPLTIDELRAEVDQAEIILNKWLPDWDIIGNCEDPYTPCCFSPVPGTLIKIKLIVSLIVKIGKMHDIIVYGELDPDY